MFFHDYQGLNLDHLPSSRKNVNSDWTQANTEFRAELNGELLTARSICLIIRFLEGSV